jgi:7-cyano-7-deazaguanine synthase in queuosine biosynthesis
MGDNFWSAKSIASGGIIRFAEDHGGCRKSAADALGRTGLRDAWRRCGARTGGRESAARGQQIASRIGSRLEIVDIPELLHALQGDRLMTPSENSMVPFGNAIALSLMMLCAIRAQAPAIYVGYQRHDAEENAGYARPAMDRLESLAAIDRDPAPKIIAPFLHTTKTEVFKLGAAMGVPYDLTWSCLRAGRLHCGRCTACRARRRAFADAGLVDPTRYEEPTASESIGAGRLNPSCN